MRSRPPKRIARFWELSQTRAWPMRPPGPPVPGGNSQGKRQVRVPLLLPKWNVSQTCGEPPP